MIQDDSFCGEDVEIAILPPETVDEVTDEEDIDDDATGEVTVPDVSGSVEVHYPTTDPGQSASIQYNRRHPKLTNAGQVSSSSSSRSDVTGGSEEHQTRLDKASAKRKSNENPTEHPIHKRHRRVLFT